MGSITEAVAQELGFLDDGGLGVHHFQLAGHLFQRDLDHFALLVAHHVAVLVVEDQLTGLRAQAAGKDTVIGAGAAAALGVAGNGHADVEAALLGELFRDFIGDGGVFVVLPLLLLKVLRLSQA